MIIHNKIRDLRLALTDARSRGETVGLVPTMGFLHEGHTSLMERAASECDVVASSIFVNPLQFGAGEDLESYPRDMEGDEARADKAGVSHLFVPSVDEMFPTGRVTSVSVGPLGGVWEGASRPTHFAGVATVVAKLFGIAGPCRAYFGEKDFQQLTVIRNLIADLSMDVEVVGCPTVREEDGLALSSRNVYLSAEERAAAPVLHQALVRGRSMITSGERDPAVVAGEMTRLVSAEPLADLDYAVAVNAADLIVPHRLDGEVRLLSAARFGRARLIDNIGATCTAG